MTGTELVGGFHAAVARDLAVYMAVIAALAGAAWLGFLLGQGRWWLAAAVALSVAGGGLAAAAHLYRQGIPTKVEEDLRLVARDPAGAAAEFVARHGSDRTWPHFLRLTFIWGALAASAGLAMLLLRYPSVRGAGTAVVVLCVVTWVLDAAAYRRDVAYAASWDAVAKAGAPSVDARP